MRIWKCEPSCVSIQDMQEPDFTLKVNGCYPVADIPPSSIPGMASPKARGMAIQRAMEMVAWLSEMCLHEMTLEQKYDAFTRAVERSMDIAEMLEG